jgi:glucose-6-phosphate 1-dehydrogenase
MYLSVSIVYNMFVLGSLTVMKAGKGLNERKAEVRIQFHAPPAAYYLYPTTTTDITRNELVVRMQPEEAIYLKTNVKKPGLSDDIITSELDLSYKERFPGDFSQLPDAYTRLILEVFRGNQAPFVRDDELRAAWKIFSPFLEKIADQDPIPYEFGSRGPAASDELVSKVGFRYHGGTYQWLSRI